MKKNLIRKVLWVVIALAVIVVTVCIIYYAIPNSTVQSIVTTIVAAVYGGLLTLLGVAWTIKKGDKDRKEDLHYREKEKREDERKKYFPYIKLADTKNADYCVYPKIYNNVHLDKDIERLDHNTYFMYNFGNFAVKNIADAVFILDSILINENCFGFLNNTTLEKNSISLVKIAENTAYYCSWVSLKNISLIFKDILGNKYKAKCSYRSKQNELYTSQEIQDKKYTCLIYNIEIIDILLPELMQEEK